MSELADLSLAEVASQIANRTVSPVEVAEAVLRRIDATEPVLHAYVSVDREGLLSAARSAEQALTSGGSIGPLHGVPIAVKDIFDVEGVPTQCGSRVRQNAAPAQTDAWSVANVRAAGAIFTGKTVTQEFAAGVVSVPARNPWDPERIPGGSSGGSGASVAVGSSYAAFGSDTGGSIRNPASTNGVVGLKPTYGLIDTTGVYPLSWALDTVGPLARSVEDAAILFNAMSGTSLRADATSELGRSLRGVRVGLLGGFFTNRLQPDVATAFQTAAGVLREAGAEVVEVEWTDAALARSASFVINRIETVAVHAEAIHETPELFGEELRLRIESNMLYPAAGYVKALRIRTMVRESMARFFAEHGLDAVIAPAAAGTAALATDLHVGYEDGSKEHVNLAYTRLTMPFNATGQPVIAVPCGFDRSQLPIGLQIAGRPYAEATICGIAHAFERSAGWADRRPPIAHS